MHTVILPVKRLAHAADLALPAYATSLSAGCDVLAAVDTPYTLTPNTQALIPTGLACAIPNGYELQVRPRSGLAAKHGITLVNSPGTIDADYRGEIKIIMINHGEEDFVIERGMRIAQLVLAPVVQALWETVEELDKTKRGAGGFGSTGIEMAIA